MEFNLNSDWKHGSTQKSLIPHADQFYSGQCGCGTTTLDGFNKWKKTKPKSCQVVISWTPLHYHSFILLHPLKRVLLTGTKSLTCLQSPAASFGPPPPPCRNSQSLAWLGVKQQKRRPDSLPGDWDLALGRSLSDLSLSRPSALAFWLHSTCKNDNSGKNQHVTATAVYISQQQKLQLCM